MAYAIEAQRAELNEAKTALDKAFQMNLAMQLLNHSPQEIKDALIREGIEVPKWLEDKCA